MRIAPRSAPAPPRRSWLRSAAPPSPSSVGPATPTSRPASATTATIPSPPSSVSASRHQGDYEKTLVSGSGRTPKGSGLGDGEVLADAQVVGVGDVVDRHDRGDAHPVLLGDVAQLVAGLHGVAAAA